MSAAIERGVEYLTLFAFSSENWRRPAEEVSILMDLFLRALEQEVAKLHENGIRFKAIGDTSRFPTRIRELIAAGEALTARNTRAHADDRRQLRRALGHRAGGAALLRASIRTRASRRRRILPEALEPYLAMGYAPEPDLFIRTGGEQRISNFLLWQLAYTELYFTDLLWPDFDAAALDRRDRVVPEPRAPLRPHQRAGAGGAGRLSRRLHHAEAAGMLMTRILTALRAGPRRAGGAVPAAAARLGARDARASIAVAADEWARLAGFAAPRWAWSSAARSLIGLELLFSPLAGFARGWPARWCSPSAAPRRCSGCWSRRRG